MVLYLPLIPGRFSQPRCGNTSKDASTAETGVRAPAPVVPARVRREGHPPRPLVHPQPQQHLPQQRQAYNGVVVDEDEPAGVREQDRGEEEGLCLT